MVGRIPVMDVTPVVNLARHPAKASVGEFFDVTALVFREGHDQLGAEVVLTDPDGVRRPPKRMHRVPGEVSRMAATVCPDAVGSWTFEVQSWSDPIGTWLHDAGIKVRAGVDVELMFAEGVLLLERVSASHDHRGKPLDTSQQALVNDAIKALGDTTRPVQARLAAAESEALAQVFATHPLRDLLSIEGPYHFFVDRERALFSSWYEFFPRSEGAYVDEKTGKVVSGTFRTAAERLPAVAAMGFDVIYLPPIHPIGEVNRKGANNTLTPTPDDVGSPWAIGSKDGGHDAIHPDLGTFADFDAFVEQARAVGLEVALDFALQAAPDHPWATEHPEWFTTRADGTIAYAENPPKKYQDIYPINFDNDPDGIYAEIERLLRHWMSHGVRIFRVDNPHTKPVVFWEWLLAPDPRHRPGRGVPLRGVHDAPDDAGARDGGLPPELHLLHLAQHPQRDRDLPARGLARDLRGAAAELLREHPGHPARVPAVRRPAGVQDPCRDRGHRVAQLGRLLRLRALRAHGREAGQRGVPRLGEVPDPHP